MSGASLPVALQKVSNVQTEVMAAPRVYPLNVTPEVYAGCSRKGIMPSAVRSVPQVVNMPVRAPEPVIVPQNALPPKYKNLCWALRNGMVDASQFDQTELFQLGARCAQLGYAGACPPSPLVALWLNQQRRAGTLPHITVRPSDLDAIPQAPDLTGKTCAQAAALEGLSGYRRGLGAAWGDAGSIPTTQSWLSVSSPPTINWRALLIFGVLGVGLIAYGRR